ncbi:type II secretion system minor pseudopilin GspK [Roseivivax sediminis]|uniref:Type II secretion system protein K n=1 Tax=Roseivivax sediminis TaxID=936889 RepID=A0A1I2AAK3_9RHOB|nr:type II secretion system minor pseudopilin GspK [Roseivivax sediminis]SFE41064.1 general secretion pathway protein K [Roseivivax sediminis]
MIGSRGIVLLNALVLVAALAGATALLLARAERQRVMQAETNEAAQLRLYLGAYEALAIRLLTEPGPVDHPGEAWAEAARNVTLDRGGVSGRIVDLQGRLNVNWLTNPEDAWARDAFERLAARIGVPQSAIRAIAQAVSPEGAPPGPFARRAPPEAPPAGPVLMLEQLEGLPALASRDYARLRPFVAALPGSSALNLNTAPAEVLRAALPGLPEGRIAEIVATRQRDPFTAVDAALASFGAAGAELDETRFAVGSTWFRAEISASLPGRRRSRVAVLERQPLPRGVRVAYRLDDAPRPPAP